MFAPLTDVGMYQGKSLRLQHYKKTDRYYGLHSINLDLQYFCDVELSSGHITLTFVTPVITRLKLHNLSLGALKFDFDFLTYMYIYICICVIIFIYINI